DGRVSPCNSFAHHGLLNLFENGKLQYTLEEFLQHWENDAQVLDVRNEANVYRSSICMKCDLWMLCNCGCPMTWGCYDPQSYINDGLYGITAEHVYACTTTKFNP
ncbi:MAG: SPASM domain-containing protein, partial [Patescibacteria group bacterium]